MHDLERARSDEWLRYARLTCDAEGVYSVRALSSHPLGLLREGGGLHALLQQAVGQAPPGSLVELAHALALGQPISWGCCVRRDDRDPSFRAELAQALLKLCEDDDDDHG
jgi:hypothetical protein